MTPTRGGKAAFKGGTRLALALGPAADVPAIDGLAAVPALDRTPAGPAAPAVVPATEGLATLPPTPVAPATPVVPADVGGFIVAARLCLAPAGSVAEGEGEVRGVRRTAVCLGGTTLARGRAAEDVDPASPAVDAVTGAREVVLVMMLVRRADVPAAPGAEAGVVMVETRPAGIPARAAIEARGFEVDAGVDATAARRGEEGTEGTAGLVVRIELVVGRVGADEGPETGLRVGTNGARPFGADVEAEVVVLSAGRVVVLGDLARVSREICTELQLQRVEAEATRPERRHGCGKSVESVESVER